MDPLTLPPSALVDSSGAAVTGAVVHDWDDDSAIRILQRTADAAGPEARVFVVEKVGEDGETPRTSMNLLMLAWFGGKERSVTELRALSDGAGLTVTAVHPAGGSQIVELRGRSIHELGATHSAPTAGMPPRGDPAR